MREEKKFTAEEAVRFLDVLESENEEQLTKIIEEIQDVEQKTREIDYTLRDMDKKQDININFFSPVGVFEEGEERKSLLQDAENLKEVLPKLNEKLEQYKNRKEQLFLLKQMVEKTSEPTVFPVSEEKKGGTRSLHILETQECDRNRIARDLHDSSVQSLTSLVHKTELCMRLMDIDTIRVKLELQTMIETIKTIINGMREIIYDLRPMSLNNLGLAVTVESYCIQLQKNYDIKVNFQRVGEEPELLSILKVTLYRILQEACSNIVKHAKASNIDIWITYENEKVLLKIQDNGIGFDTETLLTSQKEDELHGFGLTMMKERVALLGGTITIESVMQKGTTIMVDVPVKTEKEETDGED
ncbi:MAG: sensor histidine kinase [Lachnospiraceae bacterium]|nr:sensor histidine kinase [Lachnospiraceae bacterium]